MINILVIESREEDGILQEVIDFLSSRTQCQVTHLTSSPQALKFPGLEIHLNEQTVYRDGVLVPMTYHEYCPKYKQETLINVRQMNTSVVKEADTKTQSR